MILKARVGNKTEGEMANPRSVEKQPLRRRCVCARMCAANLQSHSNRHVCCSCCWCYRRQPLSHLQLPPLPIINIRTTRTQHSVLFFTWYWKILPSRISLDAFKDSRDSSNTVQWYGDGAGNTLRRTIASSLQSECASCRQQGHVGSKTLLQQNLPVLNCECQLLPVDLYNEHKTTLLIVIAFDNRCQGYWLLVKVLHPTQHKIGHFRDVLEANLLAWYVKKQNLTQ